MEVQGFPDGANGKEPICQRKRCKRCGFDPRDIKNSLLTALEVGPPRARSLPVQGSRSGASFSAPGATTASHPPQPPVLRLTTQNPTVFLPPGHSQASLSSPDLLSELQLYQPKHLPTYHGQSCQPTRTVPLPSADPASPNRKASACDTTVPPVTQDRDPAVPLRLLVPNSNC